MFTRLDGWISSAASFDSRTGCVLKLGDSLVRENQSFGWVPNLREAHIGFKRKRKEPYHIRRVDSHNGHSGSIAWIWKVLGAELGLKR